MLEQLKKQEENEDVITQMAIKLKWKTSDQPVEVLPQLVKAEEKVISKKEKTEERSMEVEPYIPQFVSRTRSLQIILEHELEKYEKDDIVKHVFLERDIGRAGRLRRRTYSEPRKWKCGKRKLTIQYGCCYNFAQDKEGNLPGIIRHDKVDPLPSFIKRMIKQL
ncbi:uncharacterized protein LOC110038914, partial [Phalaenopsis equestris]|uniref:uncharacterized protein LOC110038914 n=1 Tax=Phalaenopsis equestris TaxID=78828 RepID=UPI0009E65497